MSRFCPLFSGSSGNSMYIGSGREGILIDAGRSAKQLDTALKNCGIDPGTIRALFITHEHSDHIQGLRVFASKYNLCVYTSAGTLQALHEMNHLCEKYTAQVIEPQGVEAGGMFVTPFSTPHDSRESVGYVIRTGDGRRVTIATDLGYVTPEVRSAVTGSDLVVIESNHDVGMLKNGGYPYYLKRRILSERGHLSNESCACELPELVRKGSTRFVLAHLSRENNLPQLALETSLCALTGANMKQGVDFELTVAGRENTTGHVMLF